MKKLLALMLTLVLTFSLAACGGGGASSAGEDIDNDVVGTTTTAQSKPETSETTESKNDNDDPFEWDSRATTDTKYREIELKAISIATEHFESKGWRIERAISSLHKTSGASDFNRYSFSFHSNFVNGKYVIINILLDNQLMDGTAKYPPSIEIHTYEQTPQQEEEYEKSGIGFGKYWMEHNKEKVNEVPVAGS